MPLLAVFGVGFIEIWFAVPTGLALGLPAPIVWIMTVAGSMARVSLVAVAGASMRRLPGNMVAVLVLSQKRCVSWRKNRHALQRKSRRRLPLFGTTLLPWWIRCVRESVMCATLAP